ncbi:hypothetical protein ATANTOWER_027869 [Ataeniobius toweri]|uniref:Uncharacterized protein n=1 Tax=Ataeniobius toweri TaxID=208326 RepID=A0ABU7A9H1_9TELE|nr:hypothetical protein [Ataeniobius toweri]
MMVTNFQRQLKARPVFVSIQNRSGKEGEVLIWTFPPLISKPDTVCQCLPGLGPCTTWTPGTDSSKEGSEVLTTHEEAPGGFWELQRFSHKEAAETGLGHQANSTTSEPEPSHSILSQAFVIMLFMFYLRFYAKSRTFPRQMIRRLSALTRPRRCLLSGKRVPALWMCRCCLPR